MTTIAWRGTALATTAPVPRPHRFDIRRNTQRHLGFGIGAHFCVGAARCRLELRVFFWELLPALGAFYPRLDAAERVHSATSRGFAHLPVQR